MPDLFSIIIPNWNGKKHLEICLNALRAQTYPSLEVIIADNASSDGSQEFITSHFPEVQIVQLPTNLGFTGACNAGLKAAKGKYLALLNNDTEADPQWVEAVVSAFERHPEAGLVASKMLLFDQRDRLHTAGDFYGIDGWPGNRGAWQPDGEAFNQETYVFSACGGSSVYRREVLDKVGLLDDDFFFSMEDIDLGWRAQLAGWRCIFAPNAIIYHHLAATGGTTGSYYDGRNAVYVLVKDLPGPIWRKYWRRILGRQMKNAWDALKMWRGKAARARLRGMLAGWTRVFWLLGKRRVVQQSRTVSIEYIESILEHGST